MMSNKKFSNQFDFSQFQKEAIDKLKSGRSLTGKNGVLTLLFKKFLKQHLSC
ncbi:MAG: hypothetical protein H0U71_04890 [Gammaproteobacteria bacterium]|nr:hypothetical protein [Gammaproteobacteria bacterium]